ncbi:GGDEF domain-containing protein [Acuticoccus sp. I52.16.1]|uniref:GGDEF domain-containing protein n=1 Tax=Acuticoccus sp. I52.16.1 TaxID=2928472 RepID=UPI001FD10B1C|nr:GGDEF domain-containing protein [Acuticoccus sp. I52.16.1]UOM34612.1 GGDEF domain-containing protein [Acuticoccus sp. I52.16.1]
MSSQLVYPLAQIAIYYGVMLPLFRFRRQLGIGTFFCALCALAFTENYLAMSVYVAVGPITYTPGSVILFAGKLPLLLLVYIREDAETVRQPIYGLLLGNLLIICLLILISLQQPATGTTSESAMYTVVDSASLSVWGTLLLFADCIAMILVYERVSRWRWMPLFVRLWGTITIILVIDQLAFFIALNLYFGVPFPALYGGIVAKIVATMVFCALIWAYLRFGERNGEEETASLADVFGVLTYRQRFEALTIESRIDVLTGVRNRRALHLEGPGFVQDAVVRRGHLGLLIIDLDHFKAVNDEYGHSSGDAALCFVADLMRRTVRSTDPVYRIGGDEFLIILPSGDQRSAARVAGDLVDATRAACMTVAPYTLSVSIGWADLWDDGTTLDELTGAADRRLYEVKARRKPVSVPAR